LIISVSVDCIKTYSSIVPDATEILNSSESAKLVDASVSKGSHAVQVADSSIAINSLEILNSSELFVIPVLVDSVKSHAPVISNATEILDSTKSFEIINSS
jgi:hypothetical protein